MKNYKIKKWGGSLRYIIPSIIGVLLIVIILGNKFLPKQLLGSVYSIEELEEKLDKVKVGDTIDYEINGYNNWEVLYTDKVNGTIDVVSKTNTEDLVLEPNQEKSYYENKLQETANKYTDNRYAVSARSVNKGDLDYFIYDTDFWLNNVNENTISASSETSTGSWTYKIKNYKMYVIPYIVIPEENTSNYNEGDKYTYSDNGVDNWIVVENRGDSLVLIPETPIELVIDDVNTNIYNKADEIINSFNQDGVWEYGNYDSRYDMNNLPNLIGTFLNQQTEKIWLYRDSCYYTEDDKIVEHNCGGVPYYENGNIDRASGATIYAELGPKTKGFRPVVTLKVSKAKEGKELTSKLKVGDNVKYSAKDYSNWRVLSIDEDAGTVDIISGGIVKNLTLTGKDDYDNLEDILQREVDAYKNGENVVSARPIEFDDINVLPQIRDKVRNIYFVNNKKKYNKETIKFDSSKDIFVMCYSVGIINYDVNSDYVKKWVTIFQNITGDEEAINYYSSSNRGFLGTFNQEYLYVSSMGVVSYTAGLRPVITLKIDSVEKLSESETEKVEKSSQKLEKIIYKEQTTKNKNYNGYIGSDNSSDNSIEHGNSNTTSSDNITNNYITNDAKGVSKGIIWYVVISLSLLNIIGVILLIMVSYMVRKKTY